MVENLFFILVEPQLGENIGAVARVISNFSFANLRIVSPRDGWPSDIAQRVSAHGIDVIKNAKIFYSLSSAIEDIHFLIATTANKRCMNKETEPLRKVANRVSKSLTENMKVGLMFGRESCGLNNEEISFADCITTIPTSVKNSSLNIAQAVAILAYELSASIASKEAENIKILDTNSAASKNEVEFLMNSLDSALSRSNFFQVPEKKEKMTINMRNMILRMQPSSQDIRTLQGMIKALTVFYK